MLKKTNTTNLILANNNEYIADTNTNLMPLKSLLLYRWADMGLEALSHSSGRETVKPLDQMLQCE